ncbi:AAA family ATPase [Chondromyces crocatus]|uniref:ATP-dependent Clp protease ATP-binding subunit n=1 Tax=Chondromyces crocatus TaxID=52 RepID=A0A0K1ET77_CHOCO|nr:AAA family ATPase [Chondromyces crocatus]AKT43857.1 ATP-dependent Clp protease ATP-binding subunit [Chondromyces crocatus]
MNAKRSLRVYFTTHADGRFTGILLRTWDWLFDRPAPAAYGISEEDVLAQIEAELLTLTVTEEDDLERYLWDDAFETRTITVEVHPETTVDKRTVIGKRRIPLRLTYLWSKLREGGFRVMLPRFNWWFIVEDLASAPEVLRHRVTSALIGESQQSLYDFRMEGEEYVRAWSPRLAQAQNRRRAAAKDAPEHGRTLQAISEELVERATLRKLPPVVGESPELEAALPLIDRTTPTSILLVGGAGVGKTTWVYRLAQRLAAWRREPDRPRPPRIYSTSADRILAGMKYIGMWQERCLALVDELSHEGDYLHVGNLLPLLRPQPDGASLADLFLPALRSEEISLLAECTEEELELCQRRAATLVSCFQVVRLRELAHAAVPALLEEYEEKRDLHVRLHPAGKKRLVQHLSMFRRDVLFPGKALRFLDWLSQEGASVAGGAPRKLYPREVSTAYARYSGLPLELIADDIPASATALSQQLQERVIGQDAACAVAARVLSRFKAGMNDPERPAGTLLFVGPTGVGKTELAKQLARTLFGDEERMIRLDMSEFMLPGASMRLLATGPGVVSLAQRVRQEPLSLVLFDELEKAHAEVFDLLLGILGEGRLTDDEGRLVDFRMTVIVMTSNLGISDRAAVGFGEGNPRAPGGGRHAIPAAVREHFRPEFFNRIDHVVPFSGLTRESLLRIVDLELTRVRGRTGLLRRGLRLQATAEARALLADLGFDARRGARPLKRVLEEQVITPIAATMAADPTYRERDVVIRVEEGRLRVG